MLFMIVGFLRAGAQQRLIHHRDDFNEHIGLSAERLHHLGVLRHPDGQRAGYLGFYEGLSLDEARTWLEQSPYYIENIYDRVEVFEYQNEIGQIA